ncbi:hypothetical protein NPX13_g3786 [Xylaria arbuscula]|uniref:Xylanolytic transcriptional activator regulatory domain-containing protein n=1 Tax=Xylaria arbuscula TaxID=114810 RepID=A0A9W8NHL0_9PEZI|nr:hypothetical protein NPX13_g3786 [Xylaria arbuscula]
MPIRQELQEDPYAQLTRAHMILWPRLTASLTNELHQLRTSNEGSELNQRRRSPLQGSKPEPPASSVPFPIFYTHVTEPLPDFTIDNLTIPARTVVELIQHFGNQYHAHAHFIQPINSLAHFYAASPLLFWTILLIASHYHIEHSSLYDKLLLPHEKLLRPFSNTAIQSIHEIHALLLLCIWPITRRVEESNPTWNYIGLAVNACMRLDLNKVAPAPPVPIWPRSTRTADNISIQTRRLTWLACLSISTQEATFLGLLPPLSSRPHLKHSRNAVAEMRDHLLPGARPKFAITEIMCNSALALEEIDSPSAQLSLVETFSRSLDMIRQTYSTEWTTDVDVLLQYAELNVNAAALVRMLTENEEESPLRFTEIQTLIIQGSEAAWRLIGDMKTMISEALAPERQVANLTMPICYPRFYLAVMFFAAVFIMRTSYMRPTTSREAPVEPLVEVYNLFRLFPHHSDMKTGMEAIQHLVCLANSGESPYMSSPLGGLTTTNRLGASLVWDTIVHLNQFRGARLLKESDQEVQEPRILPNANTNVANSTTIMQPVIGQDNLEDTNGLQLQDAIDLDWSGMNMPLPVFDIFGLEAGGHITW